MSTSTGINITNLLEPSANAFQRAPKGKAAPQTTQQAVSTASPFSAASAGSIPSVPSLKTGPSTDLFQKQAAPAADRLPHVREASPAGAMNHPLHALKSTLGELTQKAKTLFQPGEKLSAPAEAVSLPSRVPSAAPSVETPATGIKTPFTTQKAVENLPSAQRPGLPSNRFVDPLRAANAGMASSALTFAGLGALAGISLLAPAALTVPAASFNHLAGALATALPK